MNIAVVIHGLQRMAPFVFGDFYLVIPSGQNYWSDFCEIFCEYSWIPVNESRCVLGPLTFHLVLLWGYNIFFQNLIGRFLRNLRGAHSYSQGDEPSSGSRHLKSPPMSPVGFTIQVIFLTDVCCQRLDKQSTNQSFIGKIKNRDIFSCQKKNN